MDDLSAKVEYIVMAKDVMKITDFNEIQEPNWHDPVKPFPFPDPKEDTPKEEEVAENSDEPYISEITEDPEAPNPKK